MSASQGRLYIVGTPIGNLSDASERLKATLSHCDIIFCEDTRVTGKLIGVLGIHTRLERADEHVILSKIPRILSLLEQGSALAYVSDAGMPCISDPGQVLVDAALDAGYIVEVIPGPSAVTAALSISGLECERFFFEGFLPRKKSEKHERLAALASFGVTVVIFESPQRLTDTLSDIADTMGERRVAVLRELSKVHEEVLRGSALDLREVFLGRDRVRGEIVVVIESGQFSLAVSPLSDEELDKLICAGLAEKKQKSELARDISQTYALERSNVYARIMELVRSHS